MRFSRIPTNGIHLHVAEAGPLVFLLHGFPEFWYGWRNQIRPLSARGFHVVAPDQRGYNLSDKPRGVASYDLDHLSADIVGLADYLPRSGMAFSLSATVLVSIGLLFFFAIGLRSELVRLVSVNALGAHAELFQVSSTR